MIDWQAREELEAEFWGRYDSISEAYAATAEDARKAGEEDALAANEEAARLEEENHQAHYWAYWAHINGLERDEYGCFGDIPF